MPTCIMANIREEGPGDLGNVGGESRPRETTSNPILPATPPALNREKTLSGRAPVEYP